MRRGDLPCENQWHPQRFSFRNDVRNWLVKHAGCSETLGSCNANAKFLLGKKSMKLLYICHAIAGARPFSANGQLFHTSRYLFVAPSGGMRQSQIKMINMACWKHSFRLVTGHRLNGENHQRIRASTPPQQKSANNSP